MGSSDLVNPEEGPQQLGDSGAPVSPRLKNEESRSLQPGASHRRHGDVTCDVTVTSQYTNLSS